MSWEGTKDDVIEAAIMKVIQSAAVLPCNRCSAWYFDHKSTDYCICWLINRRSTLVNFENLMPNHEVMSLSPNEMFWGMRCGSSCQEHKFGASSWVQSPDLEVVSDCGLLVKCVVSKLFVHYYKVNWLSAARGQCWHPRWCEDFKQNPWLEIRL